MPHIRLRQIQNATIVLTNYLPELTVLNGLQPVKQAGDERVGTGGRDVFDRGQVAFKCRSRGG